VKLLKKNKKIEFISSNNINLTIGDHQNTYVDQMQMKDQNLDINTCTSLKIMMNKYSAYIQNDQYVYKRCSDDFIVILKKIDRTITNETRNSVFDSRYAKFRGDCFYVERIFDSQNPNNETSVAYGVNDFEYIVKKIVAVSDFNPMINEICTTGIHYFKDIRGAYFYNLPNSLLLKNMMPVNYSGVWKLFDPNGRLYYKCNFVKGMKYGKEIKYFIRNLVELKCEYINDTLIYKCNYKNGKKHGVEIKWYVDQEKTNMSVTAFCHNALIGLKYKCDYVEGIKHGKEEHYYKNGILKHCCEYVNGNKNGAETEWYDNGQMKCKDCFNKGRKSDVEIGWYESGKKSYSVKYSNNKKNGGWIDWYENGCVLSQGTYNNDKMTGKWTIYFDDGTVASENYYET